MTSEQTVAIMAAILLSKPGHALRDEKQALECIEVAQMIFDELVPEKKDEKPDTLTP